MDEDIKKRYIAFYYAINGGIDTDTAIKQFAVSVNSIEFGLEYGILKPVSKNGYSLTKNSEYSLTRDIVYDDIDNIFKVKIAFEKRQSERLIAKQEIEKRDKVVKEMYKTIFSPLTESIALLHKDVLALNKQILQNNRDKKKQVIETYYYFFGIKILKSISKPTD